MGEHEQTERPEEQKETAESGQPGGASMWEESEDLTALTVGELREQLVELSEQEKEVSYWRRVLQGRIDLIRAEIVRKGQASLSPEDLAQVLLDSREPADGDGNPPDGTGGPGDQAGGGDR